MIGEGILSASTIDSKDTTPLLYSHRATGFEHEGVKSLAQGDTPGTGSGVRTPNPGVLSWTLLSQHTLKSEGRGVQMNVGMYKLFFSSSLTEPAPQ
jgi:hypothetical protein